MNRFDPVIAAARRRQRRIYLGTAGVLVIAVLAVAVVLAGTSGTSVEIAPADAAATGSVSVAESAALAVGGAVYAMGGEPLVRVAADGFVTAERRLRAHERGGTVTVTLREKPGRVVAVTAPEAPDTRWSVDGDALAVAASLDHELNPGTYAVTADNPYFRPAAREVTVSRGETVELTIAMEPVRGSLEIASVPPGAQAAINGEPGGTTPLTLDLHGGEHEVTVEMAGFASATDRVRLTHDAPHAARTYRLARLQAALAISVSPPGGSLIVNGRRADPARPQAVDAGVETRVTYLAPGYFTGTRTVTLAPGERRALDIRLEQELGEVPVTARPAATVYVDGKRAGETPVTLELPARPHTVELRKPGYRTVERRVTPTAKRPTRVDAALITELAARLAEAPREYTSAAGGTLVLFQPDVVYTMGAARSEPGQRANEFLRTVRLTKPFYAGKHEVTNAEYAKFKPGHGGASVEPATGMSWIDAAAFCNWLSARESRQSVYRIAGGALDGIDPRADGYRLHTEAEWEWLARRAGRSQKTVFPWGDTPVVPPKAANIADETARGSVAFYVPRYTDGFAGLAPVGSFKEEASGLYDLAGNASEWVHDYYSLLPPDANKMETDPMDTTLGGTRVVKGASWLSGTRTTLRAAYRDGSTGARPDVGFRIARYLYGGADLAAE